MNGAADGKAKGGELVRAVSIQPHNGRKRGGTGLLPEDHDGVITTGDDVPSRKVLYLRVLISALPHFHLDRVLRSSIGGMNMARHNDRKPEEGGTHGNQILPKVELGVPPVHSPRCA